MKVLNTLTFLYLHEVIRQPQSPEMWINSAVRTLHISFYRVCCTARSEFSFLKPVA